MTPDLLLKRVDGARKVTVSRGDWNAKPEEVPDDVLLERRRVEESVGAWSAPLDGAEVHRREPI